MPENPQVGDEFVKGNDVWTWDGEKWSKNDNEVERVDFKAQLPMTVEAKNDYVSYGFNTEVLKQSSRVIELECKIRIAPITGKRFYSFHESQTSPDYVFVYFTRGARYIITQPMDEFESDPLEFYLDERGSILFERRPHEYLYTNGIIRDKNVITFRIKPDVPDVLVYGVETNTEVGEIRIIDSKSILSDPDPRTSTRPQDS